MTNVFESSPLFLRILLAVLIILLFFYFIFLNYREYKNNNQVKQLNAKVRSLITGHYTDKLKVEDNSDLSELVNNVNDLSEVFRLTHENLAQEKNRLTSILSYMTDGVLATDRRGKITVINDMAQKQLNVTR